MREHGCIHSGGDLGPEAHACWAFEGQQEFVDASLGFLAEGLRAGQRLAYVGSEPVAEQRERLDPLDDVGGLIDKGALQLFELGDLYELGKPLDPDAQLATYATATEAALADGYTGLRVAAQATELVADPAAWEAQIRWESVADRFISVRPLSALCGYSRGDLPERIVSDLAAVHPASNEGAGSVPFRLFSEPGATLLSGEIDSFSAAPLDRVLELALDAEEPVTLDLGELGFIDHRGLDVLAAHTRRLAAEGGCEVARTSAAVDRLCELLEVDL